MGGIVGPVMVGWIKDAAGSATQALYGIARLCLICAILLVAAVPASLKVRDTA